MTISPWLIYFADLADSLNVFFSLLTVASVSTAIVTFWFLCGAMTSEEGIELLNFVNKNIKLYMSILIFSVIGILFIPSTKTIYKMLIIPAAVNSSIAQKLPDELQRYIDNVLHVKNSK